MELLKKPKCPECQSRDFYFDILTFPLKDDESETGGIPHSEYTLDDYLREMLYEDKSNDTEENEINYTQKVFKILNQNDLHDLNKELKQSGIKPIPVRSKIEYKKSPFTIDGLILEEDFSYTEILKINQFLNNIEVLNMLAPHVQHEMLFKFLYESKLNTFNYYLQNKDIFVEQYLNILT